jgi:hypothetical protein
MFNYPIEIPEKLHEAVTKLLETGCVNFDGKSVDFSRLQKITIIGGIMKFEPPVKIKLKVGPMSVQTTISTIKNIGNGLKVEIDNSPVDVLLKPEN